LVQIFADEGQWRNVIGMFLNRPNDGSHLFVQREARCASHTWSRELLNNLPETANLSEVKSRAIICSAVGIGVNHGRNQVVGSGLGLKHRKVHRVWLDGADGVAGRICNLAVADLGHSQDGEGEFQHSRTVALSAAENSSR